LTRFFRRGFFTAESAKLAEKKRESMKILDGIVSRRGAKAQSEDERKSLDTCRDPLRRDRRHRGERGSLARRAKGHEEIFSHRFHRFHCKVRKNF